MNLHSWRPLASSVFIYMNIGDSNKCCKIFNALGAVARRCSVKKVFLKILQNSQENTCARASFLIKLQAYVIKKETLPQCFPVNFAQFLRTPFLTGHLRWLLLQKYIFGDRSQKLRKKLSKLLLLFNFAYVQLLLSHWINFTNE